MLTLHSGLKGMQIRKVKVKQQYFYYWKCWP